MISRGSEQTRRRVYTILYILSITREIRTAATATYVVPTTRHIPTSDGTSSPTNC